MLVELGLNRRQLLLVCPEDPYFGKLLSLLAAVPQLEEVDDGQMVRLQAVRAGEPMPLEPGQLASSLQDVLWHYTGASLMLACVDLNFGLDAEQN